MLFSWPRCCRYLRLGPLEQAEHTLVVKVIAMSRVRTVVGGEVPQRLYEPWCHLDLLDIVLFAFSDLLSFSSGMRCPRYHSVPAQRGEHGHHELLVHLAGFGPRVREPLLEPRVLLNHLHHLLQPALRCCWEFDWVGLHLHQTFLFVVEDLVQEFNGSLIKNGEQDALDNNKDD